MDHGEAMLSMCGSSHSVRNQEDKIYKLGREVGNSQPLDKAWWMYVVRCSDGTLYTGITTDVDRRIREHNTSLRGAKYTRSRRPVELVYVNKHIDRSTVSIAESAFKKMSRIEKLAIIYESKHCDNIED